MSGCGLTWYSKKRNAICFEPETDKDLDRLEEMLEELREAGHKNKITKVESSIWSPVWQISLGDQQ